MVMIVVALVSGNSSAQQTITYTNGENDTSPITLTNTISSVTLTISSGSAIQSGAIGQSGISLNGNVTKSGAGTLTLTGANTYTGTTVINAGTLALGAGGSVADSSGVNLANSGTTFDLSSGGNQTIEGLSGVSGSTINLGVSCLTVAQAGGGVSTFAGTIAGGGSLATATSGTLVLTGVNTYTGATTIASGTTLQFDQTSSLYSGQTTSWTAGNIAVASGAVLAVNAGGAGEFTAGNVTTLLENLGTGTGGFAGGSALGVNTTDASGGNFTYSGVITDTHAGNNSLGMVKLGSGTLSLAGNNTFTGTTTISAGTLQLNGSLAAGSTVDVGSSGTLSGSGTVNGNVALTGNGVINFTNPGNIGGTLNVTGGNWNGAGTVTGAVTASSGTFTIGAGAILTANSGLNVTNTATLSGQSTSTLNGSLNYTSSSYSFSGPITGVGNTVTVNNPQGALTLLGASTYTGATTVTAGILFVDGSTSSASTVTVGPAGTFYPGGGGVAGGNVNLNGGQLTMNSATIDGALNINGGTWVGGNGTVYGPITVSSGLFTLKQATVTAPAGFFVTGGSVSDVNSGSLLIGSLTYTSSSSSTIGEILDANSAPSSVTVNNPTANLTISNGNYTGPTTIKAGTLTVDGPISSYSTVEVDSGATLAGNGSGTVNGNVILLGSTINMGGFIGGTVTATGNSTIDAVSVIGPVISSSGNLTIGSGGNLWAYGGVDITGGSLTAGNASSTIIGSVNYTSNATSTFAGAITGAGNTVTMNNSLSTLTLSGANTYTGGTILNAGELVLGSSGAIGTAGTITFGGGTLGFTPNNTSDYSSRFSTAANQHYSLDTGLLSVTLASNLTSSGGSLTKLGSGTLTLTGSNTYSGGTAVNGGALRLGSSGAIGSTGAISFGGGWLQFTSANATDYSSRLSHAADQLYAFDTNGQSVTFAGNIVSSGGSLAKFGAGTLTLTGNNTYSGATSVGAGALNIQSNGALSSTSGVTVVNGAALQLQNGVTSGSALNLNGNGISNQGALENVSGNNSYSGSIVLGTSATIGVDSGTLNLTNTGYLFSSNYLLTLTGTGTGTFAGVLSPRASAESGFLQGSGFAKTGTGTWILTGDNSNSDTTTTITSGTLQVGNGGPATASLGYGSVVNNGTLIYDAGVDGNGNSISGSGNVIKEGPGTVGLAYAGSYTGGTEVKGGTLVVDGTSLGTGAVVMDSGTLLDFNGNTSSTQTLVNTISGLGAVAYDGGGGGNNGVFILTGANTYTGGTTVSGQGTLELSGAGTLGNSNGSLTMNGGTLDLGGTSQGVGNFAGTGTLQNTAENTISTLTIGNGNASGGNFSGTIQGIFLINLVKTGTGTQTLSGIDAYNGSTTVAGGTLQFSQQTALYAEGIFQLPWTTSNIIVDSGATLAMNVGGSGEFTASDVTTILALGSSTGGFKSGSTFGLDTSNSSGGNFVYSGNIANPNNGFNVIGLEKLGTGTLVLSGANTYSGATAIQSGTLRVTGSISSSAVSVAMGATLSGTGTTGFVTVGSGGKINIQDGMIGTLTVGGLSSGNAAIPSSFSFDIQTVAGTTSVDKIADTGSLTLSGTGGTTITIGNVSGTSTLTNASHTYALLTYTGMQQALSDFTLATTSLDGKNLSLSETGDTLFLNVGIPATATLNIVGATYSGSSHSVTATTNPSGLATIITYNGSTTAPTNAGSYSVIATINDPTYAGFATGTLVVSQAPATVTLDNVAATYNGVPQSASATTNPPGLTVNYSYNGTNTPPIAPGTYAVVATIDDTNYQGSVSGSFTIAKPPFSSWASAYFTPQQLTDTTISGPAAMPEKDGVPNLLKYLYNIRPSQTMNAADRAALPVFAINSSGNLTLTFREFVAQTGITLHVESSGDLQSWSPLTQSTTLSSSTYTMQPTGVTDPNTGDPYMQVEVQAAGSTQFIRLNVTSP